MCAVLVRAAVIGVFCVAKRIVREGGEVAMRTDTIWKVKTVGAGLLWGTRTQLSERNSE